MAIIMVVSAMAIPSMQNAILSARVSRATADVRTIGQAALGYYAENGAAPNTLADIGYDQQMDPWDHPYQYLGFTATTPNILAIILKCHDRRTTPELILRSATPAYAELN